MNILKTLPLIAALSLTACGTTPNYDAPKWGPPQHLDYAKAHYDMGECAKVMQMHKDATVMSIQVYNTNLDKLNAEVKRAANGMHLACVQIGGVAVVDVYAYGDK